MPRRHQFFFAVTPLFVAMVMGTFGDVSVARADRPLPADQATMVVKRVGAARLYTVPITAHENLDEVIAQTVREPSVAWAVPNLEYRAVAMPNDPRFSSQWYLSSVNAPTAWDTVTGSRSIIVAVLDSGVDTDHPDLRANMWSNSDEIAANGADDDGNGFVDDRQGWDFVADTASPLPKFDSGWTESGVHHGTAVAGIVGAVGNNGTGITGMAWQISIMPLRVLDGRGIGTTASVYEAIRYAADNGADFINLSFVGEQRDAALTAAITYARERGVVVVAAAGNENVNLDASPRYPVCDPGVIGVGGINQSGTRWVGSTGGSNYGSTCVDIAAPAAGMLSTAYYAPEQGLAVYYLSGWSGTSLATPLVTGTAVLVQQANPSLTNQQAIEHVLATAGTTSVNGMGHGTLDAGGAITPVTLPTQHVVTGAGPGGGPHVRVLDGNGVVQSQFFAYDQNFRGGVNVTTGDLDGDGTREIITAPASGGGPHVRIFDTAGRLRSQFFAYDPGFRSEVAVAAGDLNGDGMDEIVTGTGPGSTPHVRTFDDSGKPVFTPGFFAYGQEFRGGVNVAIGDVDGDGFGEIITGAGPGGGPHVRIFDRYGKVKTHFFPFHPDFRGGVRVGTADVDGDAIDELAVAVQSGDSPWVKILNLYPQQTILAHLLVYPASFHGGVRLGRGDVDGDGLDEVVTGAGPGGGPHVRVLNQYGTVENQFFAYDQSFRGGVTVGTGF